MAHSHIGASSMHRWANCPGSVRLSRDLPSVTSKYAAEGTRAHEIAASYLDSKKFTDIDDASQEMLDAVCVYIDAVNEDLSRAEFLDKGSFFLVEHKFDLSSIHPGLYGTSDCVIYLPKTKTLIVYDYKHGAGVAVEAESNEQLMYYGLGALLSTGALCDTVVLKIVQPRCDHPNGFIREWALNTIDLLDFAADLKEAALRTEDPNAPLKSGAWCRFCPAAALCPELHKKALTVAKNEFKATLSYDPVKLSETLDALPALEAFVSQVREFAYAEAMHGRLPPGYKLVAKRATRKWRMHEDDTASALECMLPDQECYWVKKLKTPAQVEKLLGKTGKADLADLVVFESAGLKLARLSEPGEPLKLDAKSEFDEIT